jgi:DNA-binding response OmpR family regulator
MNTPTPRRRVLLVDDDVTLTEPLQEALERLAGFAVTVAADGALGLQALVAARPDCVVVDIRMAGLDGYQFIHAVRGDATTADIPLVVLSALTQPGDRLAGYLSGADAYLHKPADLDEVFASIEQAIRLTASERWQRLTDLARE